MKLSKWLHMVCLSGLVLVAASARADDTDLFNQPPGATMPAPNILFILDNSANWNANSEAWGTNGETVKQGDAEIAALAAFANSITKRANIGLMMYTGSGNNGGYVRYGIRPMAPTATATQAEAANKTAFTNMLAGTSVTGDSANVASRVIPNAYYETWRYLNGAASWAGMDPKADYAGNTGYTPAGQSLTSGFAYQGSATGASYNSPLGVACAPSYIIYIHNNKTDLTAPSPTAPSVTTLASYGYTSRPDIQSAWARFLRLRPDLGAGTTAAENGAVTTYTIDVYNDATSPRPGVTDVLKNMAQSGGGQYFQVKTRAALDTALHNILDQIQAVNSVFASASLPVSVSVRGTYLNQVYLGVFRPDPLAKPNWVGNLKQYKLGVDTTVTPATLFLADSTGAKAENLTTGFVNPSAISYWTQASTFWDPMYYVSSQGTGGSSDSPDGDLVEKGGAAQYIRRTFATDQSTRKIYTCTGTCGSGSLLSATPFNTAGVSHSTNPLATTLADHQAIINWVRGGNVNLDDPANASSATTNVRGFSHGDVLHSRPAVINYNRPNTDSTDSNKTDDIVVYYGANDGILHAVKGGQTLANGDGNELWGFVAAEHFPQFKRMRDHAPTISSSNTKPYFIDGSPTVYTYSTANDGRIDATRGDKAYLFITMRRGGRFVYALDVSDPLAPKLLWKRSNADTGFGELGQSWSDMRVAKLRYQANPVLIFGLGYDAGANDPTSQGTATMGRGVMVLDATTGNPIWQAGPAPAGATYNKTVAGMTHAIPAALTLYDSDRDGNIDRIYAVDTGANVWRINVNDADPTNWTVNQLASLGGTDVNARKFLFPPDVIPADPTNNFDSLLLGSGDREHPFDTYIQNRYYMIKDDHGLTATRSTPITEGTAGSTTGVAGQLYDATSDLVQVGTTAQAAAAKTALATASGWYVTLASGEKVVGGSTTLAGTVFFGTNTPAAVAANACVGNLGEARIYGLNYLNAAAAIDQNRNGVLNVVDRSYTRAGGGYPPTPVPISVVVGGRTYQGAITGTQVLNPPAPTLGRRYRTFWQRMIDKS